MVGTFYAREPISVLYSFVREALQDDWMPFELFAPGGLKLNEENLAFNECGLVSPVIELKPPTVDPKSFRERKGDCSNFGLSEGLISCTTA